MDMGEEGPGWTCFGGSGVGGSGATLDDAPRLGAWAPGGGDQVLARDVGIPLAAGSQVVMQVHYNLPAGQQPDTTAARLRLAYGEDLAELETMLLPAPVELSCRPRYDDGELCDRKDSPVDAEARFGAAAQTVNFGTWDFDDQGGETGRAGAAARGRHGRGQLPPRPGAAGGPAGLRGSAGPVRRVGGTAPPTRCAWGC